MLTLAVLTAGVMLVVTPGALAAPPATQGINIPTTACTLTAPLGTGNCTVQLTGFQVVGGQPNAVFNILNSAGQVVSTITTPLTGLLQATGSCQILDLTIGPINLDLLGLVVTTNAIHLNITAQSGPGNLLGNLLCAVAHLLDNPSQQLTGVVNLLNNILRQGGTLNVVPAV